MQILYVAWYHLIFLPASNLKGTFICKNKCFRNEQSIKQYQRMRKQIWRTHNMNSGNERHAVTVDRDSRNGRVLAVRSDPTCKHTKKTQKTSVTGWLFINYCWETMLSQICIECCRDSVLINVADIGDLDSSSSGWGKSAETIQGFVRGTCHFSLIFMPSTLLPNVYSNIQNSVE